MPRAYAARRRPAHPNGSIQNGTIVVSRPSPGGPAGEDAAELDGVHLDDRVGGRRPAAGEDAACGSAEAQGERLPVAACPLGHDVGDDAAVVVGGQDERCPGRAGHVDPVHPGVAQVDRVDEVAERPLLDDGSVDLQRGPAHERRHPRALAHGHRRDGLEPRDELRGREVDPLGDLRGRERGLERSAVGLLVAAGRQHLVHQLARRRAALAGAEHVQVHPAHVPVRALGLRRTMRRRPGLRMRSRLRWSSAANSAIPWAWVSGAVAVTSIVASWVSVMSFLRGSVRGGRAGAVRGRRAAWRRPGRRAAPSGRPPGRWRAAGW